MAGETPLELDIQDYGGVYECMTAYELALETVLRDMEELGEEERCIQLRDMLDNDDNDFSIVEWEIVDGPNIPIFFVAFNKDLLESKFGEIVTNKYFEDGNLIIELKSRDSDDTEITTLEGLMEYLYIARREEEMNNQIPERKFVFDDEGGRVYALFIPGIDSCSPSVLSLKNIFKECSC